MFKNRLVPAVVAAALCAAVLVPMGCKKNEVAKPAATAEGAVKKDEAVKLGDPAAAPAPAAAVTQPDVDLAAGDGIVGWMSVKSLNATFDAVEAIGGKLGAIPPGGQMRAQGMAAATAALAQGGIKDLEWLDKTRAIHLGFHDQPDPAAAPGAAPDKKQMAGGIFLVLPITTKDAALAAMPTALKDAAAEGHAAAITPPGGTDKMYIDFLPAHIVITMLDKDRYSKVKGFAERISKLDPPSTIYVGVSMEDLSKTRGKEIEALMGMMEAQANAGAMAGDPGKAKMNAQVLGMYSKMLKTYMTDLTRFELLVNADLNAAKVEFRVQAKEGSKLGKQLAAGKGRTTAAMANLLPANSYFTVAASSDPAAAADQMDEAMLILKEIFKMDPAAWEALSKDIKDLVKLNTGNSAMGAYADGPAALGLLIVGGTSDGEAMMRVGKRVVGQFGVAAIAMAKAESAAKDKAESPQEAEIMALVQTSLKEGKLEPILTKFGPMMEPKGVKITVSSTKDGDIACDVLDISLDYTKMAGHEAEQVKAVIGDKTAVAVCASKTNVAFAAGPGALEKAKAATSGKVAGLADAPAYKAAVGDKAGSCVMYINPGAAMAAFKALVPPGMTLPGDKALTLTCANYTKSYACAFEVPVDLAAAAKNLAMPSPGGMGPTGGAPGGMPTGGAIEAPVAPPPPSLGK